jgi:diacylglycerol kinase
MHGKTLLEKWPMEARMMTKTKHSSWKRFNPKDKLRVFGAGMRFAISHDRNVAVQIAISLAVLAVTFWLREWFDFVLIMIVTGNVLVFEMLNTAVEAICDYIEPDYDPQIGAIKDVAAAATGIAMFVWVIVILYEVVQIGIIWKWL